MMSDKYDYIICGGGTAGCVIAARLAERSNASILLIEAGPPRDSVPPSAIPAGVSQILGTEADWNIQSEPCAQLNNRNLHLGRGKFLGGSSGCNGTLCIRGVPQDYDDWGMEGWSGAEVFEYMKKVENFQNKEWFKAQYNVHGKDGPLTIAPHDPAPISKCVLESFQSKGLPLVDDMFTTGETANGCGHALRTIHQGVRTCSTDYLAASKGPGKINILTGQYVDKVVIDGTDENTLRASAVIVRNSSGEETTYGANKEIIITAGAYGSPAILLRSGIGPVAELNQVGVKPVLDLSGVGKNLMDHLVLLSFYEVSQPNLTNDHLIWHTGAKEKTIQEYKTSHSGFMSRFPFGVFAFARLDERLKDSPAWQEACRHQQQRQQKQQSSPPRDPMNTLPSQPHIEIWNTECYSPKYMFKDFPPDNKYAFAMATTFFSPRTRGQVTLASKDAFANPKVQHNFLADPLDMVVFSEGCQLANEIAMEGKGTKDVIVGSWPVAQGHDKFRERDEWQEAIRQRADTCYHPGGTCKMGKDDDDMAVVDAQLRVKGVAGLRVADASIMPTLMSGHPQMAVYAIGEKAADLLLGS